MRGSGGSTGSCVGPGRDVAVQGPTASQVGKWEEVREVQTHTHTQARSNNIQSIAQTYHKHENAKKTSYLHRVLEVEKGSFSPLVMATTGGMARDFSVFVKRLAELKSWKSKNTYADCIRFIRLKLSFSLIRSVTLSLRGYRGGPAENTTDDIYDL